MKRKSGDIERLCELCRFSAEIQTTEDMLCEHRGVVDRDYSCKKFVYDPLKRIPKRPPELVVPEELSDK